MEGRESGHVSKSAVLVGYLNSPGYVLTYLGVCRAAAVFLAASLTVARCHNSGANLEDLILLHPQIAGGGVHMRAVFKSCIMN